jgi:hypothetical protein
MKFFKFPLVSVFILLFVSTLYAGDEETLKQKVANNFEKLIVRSKIEEPEIVKFLVEISVAP